MGFLRLVAIIGVVVAMTPVAHANPAPNGTVLTCQFEKRSDTAVIPAEVTLGIAGYDKVAVREIGAYRPDGATVFGRLTSNNDRMLAARWIILDAENRFGQSIGRLEFHLRFRRDKKTVDLSSQKISSSGTIFGAQTETGRGTCREGKDAAFWRSVGE